MKRIDCGERILAGHELKPELYQNLLIFPDLYFNKFSAFVLALIKLATDSVFGTDFLGHC